MKKILVLLLALTLACGFSACKKEIISPDKNTNTSSTTTEKDQTTHAHSFSVATCTEAKKCSCGATEGSALGHNWKDATCTAPKTCSVCNLTEGKALNHNFSVATCTEAKKCSCGATEGSALGHKWKDATCTSPKTCSVCNLTEGKVLNHNYKDGFCITCKVQDPDATNPLKSLNTSNNYYYILEANGDELHANIFQFVDHNSNKELWFHSLYFTSNATTDLILNSKFTITHNEKKYYEVGGNGLFYNYELTDKEILLSNGYDKISLALNASGTLTVVNALGECKDEYGVVENCVFSKLT